MGFLKTFTRTTVVVALCAGIIFVGVAGALVLRGMRQTPQREEPQEQVLRVEAVEVHPESIPIQVVGLGEVESLKVVAIAAEVAGRVVAVHRELEVGHVVPEGDVLFKIDDRDYRARAAQSEAQVSQARDAIRRLERQYQTDRERLKALERSRDLARAEFDRVRTLFEQDQVGTRSGVDASERGYNTAADQARQLSQAVDLYPIRIREAKESLASAEAGLELAQTSLERTTVRAPFEARIKHKNIEANQYVAPGQNVLTLADDSLLEIAVPLDSREARNWLRFGPQKADSAVAWFTRPERVSCEIRWVEDKDEHVWKGYLDRVEQFDEGTRTVTVAVRVSSENALSVSDKALPLVAGMFCEVSIPGKTLRDAYRLPRAAVTFQNEVYRVRDNRLQTVGVKVAREQGDDAVVQEGLEPGDVVIVTRLVNPLENSLLDVTVLTRQGAQRKPAVAGDMS